MNTKEKILIKLHYLVLNVTKEKITKKEKAYLKAYLLSNFGIEIINYEKLNRDVVRQISEVFELEVPSSFYDNPQDSKYFTCEEYILEQVISYILGYGTDIKRIELYKKAFPQYVLGDEVVLRTFTIIDQKEADSILFNYMDGLCKYKRPFSKTEVEEFLYLIKEGYYQDQRILCKDNLLLMLNVDINYAKKFDYRDIVKLSISCFGIFDELPKTERQYRSMAKELNIFNQIIPLARPCPLSKRQAKFFNKIVTLSKAKVDKVSNINSPYRKINTLIKEKKYLELATYLNKSGSLLERNIRYILSRIKDEKTKHQVLDLLSDKNLTVLYQLLLAIHQDIYPYGRRFNFFLDGKAKNHVETSKEVFKRRSALDKDTKDLLINAIKGKLRSHLKKLPSLGKIYVSDEFKNIALPINTSASGSGIDVLPTGSRIPFKANFIRTFVYWHDVRDIDLSMAVLEEDLASITHYDESKILSWRTSFRKPFGNYALCSGDDTSFDGAEYQDLDINGLIKMGYRYTISCINGYGGDFSSGTINSGLQVKTNLDTRAWDPKNIEFQINIRGEGRSFLVFGLDLVKREIIVINLKTSGGQLLSINQINIAKRYLYDSYLDFNMYDLLSLRGELTSSIEEADIVFDRDYNSKTKTIIRPFDIPSLVKIVNE